MFSTSGTITPRTTDLAGGDRVGNGLPWQQMADAPIWKYCREPIEPLDEPVKMAKQVDATGFNPAGQREWIDGLVSMFHASHAPPSQVGVWRRVPN
jgi:hypothetical protein